MKHLLYIILLGLIMISCGGKEYVTMQKRLQKLNEYNKADSVFHTTTEAQALVDYFEDHGTPNEKMLAYYLLGRAYYDIHEAPLALNSFQTASEKADTTVDNCDYRQLSRVYGQMSSLFYQQGLMLQSIKCDSISIKFAYEGCDTLTALLSMANQILAYKQLGNKDIALALCEKTSKLFSKYGYKELSAIVLFSSISELIERGNLKKASDYLSRYESESGFFNSQHEIEKGREIYYYTKGYYYLSCGLLDSAEYFFRKELRLGKDFNNQNAGSRGLALLFQQKHMGDSAAKYALYSYEMNDSVYAHMATKEVEQIQGMYDYSRNQEIARQEKERADHARAIIQLISVFSFLLIILAVYIAREIHKKIKKERAEYKNKVSLLAKTQADVIKLRSYGSELNQMLTAKENETTKLLAEIEKYKERIGQQKLSSDALLENSEAYILLKKTADKALVLSEEEWQYAFMMVVDILPNFYKLISSKRLEFNDNEFKTCILLRLHFTSKDVANMLGVTQPYITKICRSLMQKLFKEDGKSKELTERLKQYS
jgi:hypothetical protein